MISDPETIDGYLAGSGPAPERNLSDWGVRRISARRVARSRRRASVSSNRPARRHVPHIDSPRTEQGHHLEWVATRSVPVLWRGEGKTLEAEFRALADRWKAETGLFSSSLDKVAHPSYREIIDMGKAVIQYILEDYRDTGTYWNQALREIAGESPVTPNMAGRLGRIRDAWLAWGKDRKYIT